jgi:SAM-dependent methyltransferase
MPRPIQFDEVADLYDMYVKSDLDIDFFVKEARRIGGKTLELTCGTGRVSLPLLHAGVDLTCVDYSRGMLTKLQEKLQPARLSCTLVESDITELSLSEQFDLIFIPFHTFQEIVDRSKHQSTLERIAAHLTESGCFICTLQNPTVRLKSIDGTPRSLGKFSLDSGGSLEVTSQLTFDAARKLARGFQLYNIYDEHHGFVETRRLEINFCLFTKNEFEQLVSSAGLRVDALYGDYSYSRFDQETSPFMIWKLRKAAGT